VILCLKKMSAESNPRINGKLMNRYIGRVVQLVCELQHVDQNNGNAIVKASDGIQVTVILPAGVSADSQYLQVTGKAGPNNMIEAFSVISAGEKFDLSNYDKAVELMNGQYQELF